MPASRLDSVPLALLAGLGLIGGLAVAATAHAAPSWVATRTSAFVPALLAADAGGSPSTLALQQKLRTASANATELDAATQVSITVALKLRHESELDAHNRSGATPLTSAEILERFAPTAAQAEAVAAHLRQAGFSGVEVAPDRLLVTATGPASAVRTAFHTPLAQFTFDDRTVYANTAAAMVPETLGAIVGSVLGLQTVVRPQQMIHVLSPQDRRRLASRALATHDAAAAANVSHNPTDFAPVYDAASTASGAKTRVGIITWGSLTQVIADLNSFTSGAGLPAQTTTVVNTDPSGSYVVDSSSDAEWCLDSQTIVGTSGGVQQLYFYTAPNGGNGATDAGITAAYNRAVSDNLVKIVNVSLGEDETAANTAGTLAADDAIFKVAVAQGQTFSVSSGDEGVYEATQGVVANAFGTVNTDLSKYSVSHPASSPYVVAIGGTTLSTVNATSWAGETVWNEGLSIVGLLNWNRRLWATGGGVSLVEAAPSYQTAALGSSVTRRTLPDLSFDAASATGANIIVHGNTETVGGTSLASPIFVGLLARTQSTFANRLGFPGPLIYNWAASAPGVFHDVTSGNNGYKGYGYNAAAGYDRTTGYGSIDLANLIAALGANAASLGL